MKSFLAVLGLVGLAVGLPTANDWLEFKASHGKNYESLKEESLRFQIFEKNVKMIQDHNARYHLGLESFSMEINEFGDMTDDEYINTILCLNLTGKREPAPPYLDPAASSEGLPDSIDWREKGLVTPIKNQALCGSCWAFSTTGSLEGQVFKKEGKLVSLSEQNLVDCSWKYGNHGCQGGLMDSAFQYIIDNGGVDTEEAYPYEGKDNKCRFNKDKVGAVVKSFVDVKKGSEESLTEAVANVGPISVAIDASGSGFRFYKKGVYYNSACGIGGLNHAVLAVGYGSEDGKDYWLVKNSWGTKWGDEGYIKMSKNMRNHCGIASYASYPVL